MSSKIKLSRSEQQYIINGIHFNHRVDGRAPLDYRDILIEPSVLRGTHGSCRIRLGDTELLCGISVELHKVELPKNQSDDPSNKINDCFQPSIDDLLIFKVDCSPNASPDFQGRGGEDIAEEISENLLKTWSRIDNFLNILEIVRNRFYWKIYCDILVLECGGSLLDASSLAIHTALKSTILPKIEIEEGDEFLPEISLVDDSMNGKRLNFTENGVNLAPVIITIHKIGQRHVVDPSLEEECCSSASLRRGSNFWPARLLFSVVPEQTTPLALNFRTPFFSAIGLNEKSENKYLLIKKSGKKSLQVDSIREIGLVQKISVFIQ